MNAAAKATLRALPAVDRVLRDPRLLALALPTATARAVGRDLVEGLRAGVLAGAIADAAALDAALDAAVVAAVAALDAPRLGALFNGTGVLVHTNAGRAPLSAAAVAALAEVGAHFANLELDLASGARGSRQALLRPALRWLSGADDALVVNNGAAALLLALSALAAGRPVIVSRGELVEIGGSFRVPDIMRAANVELVEVGTTNRTHARDYQAAVEACAAAGQPAALLLQVHRSNFDQVGFVATPTIAELAAVATDAGVPLVCDLGSGALAAMAAHGLRGEPEIEASLRAGADLVTASGDKLLGGPQAGLLFGRADLVARAARAPMARALRPCGLTLAALDATLRAHLRGRATVELPIWRAMAMSLAELEALGTRLVAVANAAVAAAEGTAPSAALSATLAPSEATLGGGSQPGATVPSLALALRRDGSSATRLCDALRAQRPAWLARPRDDAALLDLRSLACGHDDDALIAGFRACIGALVGVTGAPAADAASASAAG